MVTTKFFGLSVACDRPLSGTSTDDVADVVVERAEGDPVEPSGWVGVDDWPRVAIDGDEITLWFDGDAVFHLVRDEPVITYHLLAELDDESFAHELVDGVLPRYLAGRGFHVLHGGSVAGPGGAVVLVGESGAGKSTLAAAVSAHGGLLLGDDVALLAGTPGSFSVIPSGTQLRLYEESATAVLGPAAALGPPMAHWSTKRLVALGDNAVRPATEPCRLRAVVELRDADGDAVLEPLGGGEAFHVLARHAFDLPDDTPTAGIDVLDRWGPAASTTSVYRLRRPRDLARLDESRALVAALIGL